MGARRGRDALGLCTGAAVLAASGAIARRGISPTEVKAFRAANLLPDGAFPAIWAPMQYGTFGPPHVLVVDDNAQIRDGCKRSIGRGGFRQPL